jgi:hypothetical protein
MPPPQAPQPKPDAPAPDADAPPRRKLRRLHVVGGEPSEVTRTGHGSGCIPMFVIQISLLALLIYLACVGAALFLTKQPARTPAPATAAARQR